MPEYDIEALFDPAAYAPEWNERNVSIYRFLLSELDPPDPERTYFITHTPPSHWDDGVEWGVIPRTELDKFLNASLYNSADDAYLDAENYVREKETDKQSWIQWISVRRWISETEVEVETGVFSGPLGGGGKINVYENVDGKWKLKSRGFSWVS